MSFGFELCKKCKHPYSHHTYTDEKMGCDDCKCTLSLGDELGEIQIRLHAAEQQLEQYREALEAISQKGCGCHSTQDPRWHANHCYVKIAAAVLRPHQ